jgi:hypothetical protein
MTTQVGVGGYGSWRTVGLAVGLHTKGKAIIAFEMTIDVIFIIRDCI